MKINSPLPEGNFESIQAYNDVPLIKWSMKNTPSRRNRDKNHTMLFTSNPASTADLESTKVATLNLSKLRKNENSAFRQRYTQCQELEIKSVNFNGSAIRSELSTANEKNQSSFVTRNLQSHNEKLGKLIQNSVNKEMGVKQTSFKLQNSKFQNKTQSILEKYKTDILTRYQYNPDKKIIKEDIFHKEPTILPKIEQAKTQVVIFEDNKPFQGKPKVQTRVLKKRMGSQIIIKSGGPRCYSSSEQMPIPKQPSRKFQRETPVPESRTQLIDLQSHKADELLATEKLSPSQIRQMAETFKQARLAIKKTKIAAPKEQIVEHPKKVVPQFKSLTFQSSVNTLTQNIACYDEETSKQYFDSDQRDINEQSFTKQKLNSLQGSISKRQKKNMKIQEKIVINTKESVPKKHVPSIDLDRILEMQEEITKDLIFHLEKARFQDRCQNAKGGNRSSLKHDFEKNQKIGKHGNHAKGSGLAQLGDNDVPRTREVRHRSMTRSEAREQKTIWSKSMVQMNTISERDLYHRQRHQNSKQWREKEVVQKHIRDTSVMKGKSEQRLITQTKIYLDKGIEEKADPRRLMSDYKEKNDLNKSYKHLEIHQRDFKLEWEGQPMTKEKPHNSTKQIRIENINTKMKNKLKLEKLNWNISGNKNKEKRQKIMNQSLEDIRTHEIETGNGVMSCKHTGYKYPKNDKLQEAVEKSITLLCRGFSIQPSGRNALKTCESYSSINSALYPKSVRRDASFSNREFNSFRQSI